MTQGAPRVSIVIPNYQGREVLPVTLDALLAALEATPIATEVLLVDDASHDGSPDLVERDYPQVRLSRKPRQEGFGPTCNLGVSLARAPLVYLLNSDVSVHPGFLPPLVAQLDARDDFAAVSLNLGPDGRVRPPHVVVPRLRRGQIRLGGMDLDPLWRSKRLEAAEPLETLFGIGGSILLRRDRFLSLGGFADAFAPYYYEDTDLGWRAWRRGWRTTLVPRSLVTHREGGSISTTQARRRVRVIRKRNRFLLVWRNLVDRRDFRRRHLWRLPDHLVGTLLRGDTTVVAGFAAALRRREGLVAHRERERREAKLTDAEIFARLEAVKARLLASGPA